MTNDDPIPSTKERPGSYDAIETAKPGEPLFPIQGGDPFGPPTVLHWARLAREAGEAEADEKRSAKLLRKATDAEQVAWDMQAYQRGHAAQSEAVKPSSYTGHEIVLDETADLARKVREAQIKGAAQLHNLVGVGTDIADTLASLDACSPEVAKLRCAVEMVRTIADAIEPRRGSERS